MYEWDRLPQVKMEVLGRDIGPRQIYNGGLCYKIKTGICDGSMNSRVLLYNGVCVTRYKQIYVMVPLYSRVLVYNGQHIYIVIVRYNIHLKPKLPFIANGS